MTASDELFGGNLPIPKAGSYTSDGTSTSIPKPWFGIDPAAIPSGHTHAVTIDNTWSSATTKYADTDLAQKVYRESFKGQLETLTQIVSDNADYLLGQINIRVEAKDTWVEITLEKTDTIPNFKFPNGEMNHTIGKKYMDWLAMVQLVLQDAS